MAHILIWWIGVEAVGLLALPLAFAFFKKLPDRGYILSKPLGILLVSYLLWLAGSARILPNTRLSIFLLLLLLALLSLFILSRQRRDLWSFLKRERMAVIASEVLFTLLFLLWTTYRAYDPQISGTEKPMEFAFLNAILRSQYFPPHDPWLSGYTINYYYFGYFIMATLTKLTGVSSSVSFNLANALLFSLTATCGFSLVYNLVRWRNMEKSPLVAIGAGVVGSILIVLMGNLESILEFAYARGIGSQEFWGWIAIKDMGESPWWWRASRVISTVSGGVDLDYTIQEFPFFSFLLGDLHPHVMALPFVLLSLAIGLNLLFSSEPQSPASLISNPFPFLLTSLSLGALGFINSWDFPTYTAVYISFTVIQGVLVSRRSLWSVLMEKFTLGIALLVVAILLYIPFYLSVNAPRPVILPVLGVGTRPIHYAIFWGPLLFLGASIGLQQGWQALGMRPLFKAGARLAIALSLLPFVLWSAVKLLMGTLEGDMLGGLRDIGQRLGLLVPLIFLISLAGYAILRRLKADVEGSRAGDRSLYFALVLLLLGLFLTLGVELFFIQDIYGMRMNTVFKFYYQAWGALAIASAFGLYYLLHVWQGSGGWRKKAVGLWLGMAITLLVGALLYTFAAPYSKSGGFKARPTLDGLAYMERASPVEYEAIVRLNKEVEGTPVILECTEWEWSLCARVSASTGLPTVLGWAGHELQWRGSDRAFRGRAEDIETIYRTESVELAQELMRKYQVSYIYIGGLERSKYGGKPLEKFAGFMEIFFQKDSVTIYRVRG